MPEIILSIPEESLAVLHLPPQSAANELRMLAAVKLYEMKRLSSGAAARLAGIPRTVFLQRLAEYGIAVLDLTEDEFSQETRFG